MLLNLSNWLKARNLQTCQFSVVVVMPASSSPNFDPHRLPPDKEKVVTATTRTFDSLKAIFSSDFAAPVDIRSRDKSLHPIRDTDTERRNPPEDLMKLREGYFMWNQIFKPSTDRDQIECRRSIIDGFVGNRDFEALRELKNTCYLFRQGIRQGIFGKIEINNRQHLTALSIYRNGPKGPYKEFYSEAVTLVERGCRDLEQGRAALEQLTTKLERSESCALQSVAKMLKNIASQIAGVTETQIKNGSCSEKQIATAGVKVHNTTLMLGSLIERAGMRLQGLTGRCTFDSELPYAYKGGWSIALPASKDHRNDSPVDARVVVFSGSNMSGKTESGLKQNLFIQLEAQTWGDSTVTSGNFRIHDDFFYFDRAATDANAGMSAFGEEVGYYKTHYPTLGESPFGCIDEGGSTTDSEGQYRLLYGVQGIKRFESGKLFFSNHCEKFNLLMSRFPDAVVYHFYVGLDNSGKAIFTYELKPGIADSNSIAVAHAVEADAELIRRAELAKDGQLVLSESPAKPTLPDLVCYTEEQRATLKGECPDVLFLADEVSDPSTYIHAYKPRRSLNDLVYLESGDWQLIQDYFPLAEIIDAHEQALTIGGIKFCGSGSPENLKRLFLRGSKPSPTETLERRQTFCALAARNEYLTVTQHVRDIKILSSFLPLLTYNASEMLRVNHALNPHEYSRYSGQESAISGFEQFLAMNAKLLGSRFPYSDLLTEIRALRSCYQAELLRLNSLDINEISATVEPIRDEPISQDVMPALRKIALVSGEPLPKTETISRGAAHEFMSRVGRQKNYADIERKCADEIRLFNKLVGACPSVVPVEAITKVINKYKVHEIDSEKWGGDISFDRIVALEAQLASKKVDSGDLYRVHTDLEEIIRSDVPIRMPVTSLAPSYSNLNSLSWILHRQTEKLSNPQFLAAIPGVPWFEISAEDMRNVILPLADLVIERTKSWRADSPSGWISAFRVAILLKIATNENNPIHDLCTLSRSYDSVHLHQAANLIETTFGVLGLPTIEGYELANLELPPFTSPSVAKHYWTKHRAYFSQFVEMERVAAIDGATAAQDVGPLNALIAECSLKDPRQLFSRVEKIFKRDFASLFAAVEAFEARQGVLTRQYAEFNYPEDAQQLHDLATQKNLTSEQGYRLCRAWEQVIGKDAPKLYERLTHHLSDMQREAIARTFLEEHVRKSPVIERASSYAIAYSKLMKEVANFMSANRLRIENIEKVSIGELRSRVESSYCVRVHPIMELNEEPLKEVERATEHIATMSLWGHIIRDRHFGSTKFNNTGLLEIRGMTNLLAQPDPDPDHEPVTQDISLDRSKRIHAVNGPNMSGKTYMQKGLLLAIGASLQTGHGPYVEATMPFFDGLFYVDRVTGKQYLNLSSAGSELKNISELLPRLRSGKLSMLIMDEAWSTMSGRYQGYFTKALVSETHDLGQFAMFATHHHESVDALAHMSSAIEPWYLKYEIKDGEIEFYYKPTKGHAPSVAMTVARKLGMPEEIVRGGESAPY